MKPNDPAILYLALILPSLFSLTLIAEGIHKMLQKQAGWVSITLGLFFLGTIIGAYFFVFK